MNEIPGDRGPAWIIGASMASGQGKSRTVKSPEVSAGGMKTSDSAQKSATRLAPEDLRPGQDVAILTEVFECPTWLWHCEAPGFRPDEVVRLQAIGRASGRPLRIKAVCLPFVLVTRIDGKSRTLDVRRVQLVKLDRSFAKLVRKSIRRNTAASLARP